MARSSREPDPDPVVATVGGRKITLAHVEARAAQIRRGPRGRHLPPDRDAEHGPEQGTEPGPEWADMRRWIVQELVSEEVIAHESARAGLAAGVDLVEEVTGEVTVSDEEVRGYYERNGDLYRRTEVRRIRHLAETDEASARRAAATIGDAAMLEVRRGELTGPLEDALFAAGVGAVVGPISTEHGWHVARIDGVIPASVVPYEEARPAIAAELLAAARLRAFEAWLDARRRALAVIEPAFAHPGDPVHGRPSHRH